MKENTPQPLMRQTNMYLVFSITLMTILGVSTLTPVMPEISEQLGVPKGRIGLLITVFTLPGIVLTPVTGILADRYGRKQVLVPSLLVFATAGSVCFFLRDFEWILLFRFLQGTGAAALGSLNLTLIGDMYKGRERATAMGYNNGVLSTGTAVYPAIGGALAAIAWYVPFLLPALGYLVAIFVWLKLDSPEPGAKEKLSAYISGALKTMKNRQTLLLYSLTFITFVMLFGAILTYLPILIEGEYSLNAAKIGLLLSLMSITSGLVSSQLGRISKRFSGRSMIFAGMLSYLLALFLIPLTSSIWGLLIPLFLFGFGQGINLPAIFNLLAAQAPLQYRAIFLSVNGALLRLGQTVGPVLMGMVYVFAGIQAVFWVSAAMAAVFAGLVFFIRKQEPVQD